MMDETARQPSQARTRVVTDVFAGLSVAFVLIPQSLAYAELAGMPAWHGLYAAAVAPIAAAPLASSPYLQTGPTAMSSLLAFGALSATVTTGDAGYVGAAALLALLVGLLRIGLSAARLGEIAYYMSLPVLKGFTVAAALLILASQLPAVVGVEKAGAGILADAVGALARPDTWSLDALGIAAGVLAVIQIAKRIHPLVPGVLLAGAGGLAYSLFGGYDGPTLGPIPTEFVALQLDLPWSEVGALAVPALVIAVIGFAEPTAIARTYAMQERRRWNPNKELMSQGAANVAAGLFGGFPVGGSFSRSALNKLAGSQSRLSGLITGVFVLAFLPLASHLEALPRAVLGAVVLRAVLSLLRFGPLLKFWAHSYAQAAIAWTTFALTLILAPHIEYAVLGGLMMAIAVHAWREGQVTVETALDQGAIVLELWGVLWFASAHRVEDAIGEAVAQYPEAHALIIDVRGLGRIDYSGALSLESALANAKRAGLQVALRSVPPQAERILDKVIPSVERLEDG